MVIAHAYEELSADRSARRALGAAEARAELERGAGTQFDAAVVAAFHAGPIRYGQGPGWGGRGCDKPAS